jgi:hypothetical protein
VGLEPGDAQNMSKLREIILDIAHTDNDIGELQLPVVGNSMTPMLKEGDIIGIRPSEAESTDRGDIVVRWNNELITHRVIYALENQIYTKGDSRHWIDPPCVTEDILGKVRFIDRSGYRIDLNDLRWKVINRSIGWIGWILVKSFWSDQLAGKSKDGILWKHRLSYWLSKKLNWIIIFIFAGLWLRRASVE